MTLWDKQQKVPEITALFDGEQRETETFGRRERYRLSEEMWHENDVQNKYYVNILKGKLQRGC